MSLPYRLITYFIHLFPSHFPFVFPLLLFRYCSALVILALRYMC